MMFVISILKNISLDYMQFFSLLLVEQNDCYAKMDLFSHFSVFNEL